MKDGRGRWKRNESKSGKKGRGGGKVRRGKKIEGG